MRVLRSGACDQARWYASLEVDAELSQLERALLDAHARRCPGCAAYRVDVAAITAELRVAALETLTEPVLVRARRRTGVGLVTLRAATAAAAMLLVGVGTVSSVVSTGRDAHFAAPAPSAFMSIAQLEREVALIPPAGAATDAGVPGFSIAV